MLIHTELILILVDKLTSFNMKLGMHDLLRCRARKLRNIEYDANVVLIVTVLFVVQVDLDGLDKYLTLHTVDNVKYCRLQLNCSSHMHQTLLTFLFIFFLILQIRALVENDIVG